VKGWAVEPSDEPAQITRIRQNKGELRDRELQYAARTLGPFD
jgi:hypothetical protein